MKLTYTFSQGSAEGSKDDSTVLGGKGANLAEMCKLGLPVPPGLTIPTDVCLNYMNCSASDTLIGKVATTELVTDCAKAANEYIKNEMMEGMTYRPLVSVRSGARVSMPGMMDTILNLGLTIHNIESYRKHLGDRCALDSFRRLVQMFANVVHGIPNEVFEYKLDQIKGYKYGMEELPKADSDLSVTHLEKVVETYLEEFETYVGSEFPDTLVGQLHAAIEAVFNSWNSERAIKYRKVHGIPDSWGTAVNIQQMVFGNRNDKSCSGVLFTRDPSTGNSELMGEFLPNAQGEDVVAGIRTPMPIKYMGTWQDYLPFEDKAYYELLAFGAKLEKHYRDMQDMEFTVENDKLWILQTRRGARSAAAAFKIAYDMVKEGLINKSEALKRVSGKQYLVLNKPQIDSSFNKPADLTGTPAAGSIVTGVAVFTSHEAEKSKQPCILVASETTPEDFGGMVASVGILTTTGGATSHAAVVARGMNKTCVVGCTELEMTTGGAMISGGKSITNGTKVTLDGATGRIWIDTEVPVLKLKIDQHVREIIKWASGGESDDVLIKVSPTTNCKKYELKTWDADLEIALPEDGRVYIDCSQLVIGKNTRYLLARLLMMLMKRPKLNGILGLTKDKVLEQDNRFLGFLGLEEGTATPDETATLESQIKTMLMKKWTAKVKKAWALHLPFHATGEHTKCLSDAKWTIVRSVKKLGELMEVDGMMDIDPVFEEQLKEQGVELKQLVTLLKDAGRKVERLPRIVSKERMIFEVLGK